MVQIEAVIRIMKEIEGAEVKTTSESMKGEKIMMILKKIGSEKCLF